MLFRLFFRLFVGLLLFLRVIGRIDFYLSKYLYLVLIIGFWESKKSSSILIFDLPSLFFKIIKILLILRLHIHLKIFNLQIQLLYDLHLIHLRKGIHILIAYNIIWLCSIQHCFMYGSCCCYYPPGSVYKHAN